MKNILLLLFTFLFTNIFSQTPQGVSYQAVAFDASGNAVVNSSVGIQISILDNSATGTVVYTETFTKTTNAQGLFNLNIGTGAPTSGTFSAINWAVNSKFLKVEIDPLGGTSYTNVGINQLMSVPYALFAEKANTVVNGGGGTISSSGSFMVYADLKAQAYNSSTNTWSTVQTYSAYVDSVVASNGNFMVYADLKAQAYNSSTNTWSTVQTYSGYVDGVVSGDE